MSFYLFNSYFLFTESKLSFVIADLAADQWYRTSDLERDKQVPLW